MPKKPVASQTDIKHSLSVSFHDGDLERRRRQGRLAPDALSRALGTPKNKLTIIDTTAGLGRDAYAMAWLGCRVIALERHPFIFESLNTAYTKGLAISGPHQSVLQRLSLIHADACAYLKSLEPSQLPDIIYIDPMIEDEPRSAKIKKDIQYLRELLGPDRDAEMLLTVARQCAKKRVIVKRPFRCAPLIEPVDVAFKSRSTRYDVYFTTL